MTIQQEQACINAYQKLAFWEVDFVEFVEFAKKYHKKQTDYQSQVKVGHQKLKDQIAEQEKKEGKSRKVKEEEKDNK